MSITADEIMKMQEAGTLDVEQVKRWDRDGKLDDKAVIHVYFSGILPPPKGGLKLSTTPRDRVNFPSTNQM